MQLQLVLAAVQHRASRIACALFGWSPAFKHTGIACRGREACAAKIRRNWS